MNPKLKDIKEILSSNNFNINNIVEMKKYSKCFESYLKIFRNTTKNFGDIKVFEPKKRVSFDPGSKPLNFHTLWLSNHPDWKYYPKRDHSIIMMTNKPDNHYGEYCYRMFIPNNAKVAVCDNNDLATVFGGTCINTVYSFNNIINKIFSLFIPGYEYNIDVTYENFIKNIKYIDDNNLFENLPFENQNLISYLKNYNSLENFINKFFNTSKVSIMTLDDLINNNRNKEKKHEIWTDATCLGIDVWYIQNNIELFKNILVTIK